MKRLVVSFSVFCVICIGAHAVCAQSLPAAAQPNPFAPPAPPTLHSANTMAGALASSDGSKSIPEDEPEVDENDVVRVSTSLITIPAEVMDRSGRYIGHLNKSDFRVYENGVEQQLAYFASVEQPFTVALLLDVSGSTQSRLQAIRSAANTFISRLRPNDRLLLVSFDGKVNVLTEAVTLSELRKMRLRLDAVNDGTVLYDTVGFVLNQRLAGIRGRKAIVLLTDGVDGGSKQASYKQNIRDAEESNVVIYSVSYNTLPQLPERLSQIVDPKVRERVRARMIKEYGAGGSYLQSLSAKTGGRFYDAESLTDVPQAFGAITEELGRQYSLGYYPKGQVQPGEKRDIKVRTRSANLVVHARASYVAGGSGPRPGGQD
ncbi:MAG: VWA domain-containing protein [Acidobacteriota bacterium]|nr:VWA domain-containing protein [Acidobacteriota bacterium]